MPKSAVEFTPIDLVEYTDMVPHVEGVAQALLAEDLETGAVTRVLRFAPGADTSEQGVQVHDCWEELFIFEGSIKDMRLKKTFRAGAWATRPPGMQHGPWTSEEGAKMFEVRYYD